MAKIIGIGNSVVDVLVEVSDGLVSKYGLNKGDFNLVPSDVFAQISAEVGEGVYQSGGCAANTCWITASAGVDVSFVGKVGDDAMGQHFYSDMQSLSVDMRAPIQGGKTMVVYCLLTSDGERTFASEGVVAPLMSGDVDDTNFVGAKWLVVEGHMAVDQADAAREAMAKARANGVKIALCVSAPYVIAVARGVFVEELLSGVDMLVANDDEWAALAAIANGDDAEPGLKECLAKQPRLMTHHDKGATFVNAAGEEVFEPSISVSQVVDSTGAGDAFLAGFLTQLLQNESDMSAALKAGHLFGSRAVQQVGGRLKDVSKAA